MKKKIISISLSIMLLASFPSAAFAFQGEFTETTHAETEETAASPETFVESEATETAVIPAEIPTELPAAVPAELSSDAPAAVPAELPAEIPAAAPDADSNVIRVSRSVIMNEYGGDATTPISNALKEAEQNATAAAPYTITVDPGDYTLKAALRVCSYTTLDMTGVTLTQTSSDQNMLRIGSYFGVDERGYCYKDITLIGGIFDQKNNGTVAVKGAHVQNLTIDNMIVKNTHNAHLMEYAGVKGLTIRGCTLQNQTIDNSHLYYEAIQLDILVPEHFINYTYEALPNSNVLIEDCHFLNVPRGFGSHTAILNEPVNGVTITGCTFQNCGSTAIQGLNWNNVEIVGNTINGCTRAISLYCIMDKAKASFPVSYFSTIDSVTSADTSKQSSKYVESRSTNSNIRIQNNTITVRGVDPYSDYRKVAISLQGSVLESAVPQYSDDKSGNIPAGDYYLSGVSVLNNTIQTEGDGIRSVDCRKVKIDGNNVTTTVASGDTTAYYGIHLSKNSSALTVSKNTINKTVSNGIMVNSGSHGGTISGNKIVSPPKYGIDIESASSDSISGNTITSPGVIGIFAFSGGSAGNITNNTISSPGKYGISLSESSSANNINGNRITDSPNAAILVTHSSTAERITANSIKNTGWNSIGVTLSSTVNNITNNSISVPGNYYGIAALSKSKIKKLSDNKVRSSKKEAYSKSSDSSIASMSGNTVTASTSAKITRLVINKTSPVELATSVSSAKPSILPITATIANADLKSTKAIWTSSDTSVATVDSSGKVTAWKYGKTTITATADDGSGAKASCTIQTRFYDVAGSPNKSDKNYQYYYTPVYWAADAGITTGYNRVCFGPDRNCARRELMIFLWRLKGSPEKASYPDPTVQFNDMDSFSPTSAAYKAVAWAVATGITKGYADGGFHPDDSVNRKDTLIMLYRAAGKPKISGTITFPDVLDLGLSANSDTYKAILWGSSVGITSGYADGNFQPGTNCLREHIVTFLYRYHTKVK